MRAYFLIFLMWFVVIGIIPFLEKIYKKILQYLDTLEKRKEASTAGVKIVPPRMPQVPQETLEVYDFEVIVLTRLARAGRKGHTLKHMAGALLLYPSIVEKTLASLGTKGLIGVTRTYVAGNRYHLTRKGRNYLIQHGFIPRPHPRYWQKVA